MKAMKATPLPWEESPAEHLLAQGAVHLAAAEFQIEVGGFIAETKLAPFTSYQYAPTRPVLVTALGSFVYEPERFTPLAIHETELANRQASRRGILIRRYLGTWIARHATVDEAPFGPAAKLTIISPSGIAEAPGGFTVFQVIKAPQELIG